MSGADSGRGTVLRSPVNPIVVEVRSPLRNEAKMQYNIGSRSGNAPYLKNQSLLGESGGSNELYPCIGKLKASQPVSFFKTRGFTRPTNSSFDCDTVIMQEVSV